MILYRYIIRELLMPFLSSLSLIVFVFVMQQLVYQLDRVISKGLDPMVIIEVFMIQLAWIITLAIPMAILVATLTTFGRMSGDNEITSIKASGQSLGPMLIPVFAAATVLGVLTVYFNDLILPEANHKTANLLSDISRKKPSAFIEPKVLITDFPGYNIYTEEVNNKTGGLKNIRIFTDASGQDPSLTVADSGEIRLTPDQKYIELTLFNGETHSISRKNSDDYFVGKFARQVVAIKNIDSRFERTDSDYRGDREKNIATILSNIREFRKTDTTLMQEYNNFIDTLIKRTDKADSIRLAFAGAVDTLCSIDSIHDFAGWVSQVDPGNSQLQNALRPMGDLLDRLKRRFHDNKKLIFQYKVEVHKKFAIPFACVLFVLIGAPLGIMARRGGMSVGASYSIFFFVIYWAGLIGGENKADKAEIAPWIGMWSGNIFIALCGVVLMILMVRETTIRFDFIVNLWKNLFKSKKTRPGKSGLSLILVPFKALFWLPRFIMRKIFGILPMYLIETFMGYAFGVLIAIVVIFIAIDYVSNLRRFDGAPAINIVLYYWYYLPWIIQIMIPIVLLLASMFSIGKLAKNSELTAMKAAGINLRQLTFPLLALGVILSIGSFYGGERILPQANYSRRLIQDNLKNPQASTIERLSGIREYRRNFYYFSNPHTVYVFGEFNTSPQHTRNVERDRFRASRIIERIKAQEMIHDSTGWKFVNGTLRTFTDSSATLASFDTLTDSTLHATPIEMVARIKVKEELSYWELKGFIDAARKRGEKVQKYMGELDFKVALPFMNFIVILLGIAITARTGRRGGAVLFGIGLLLMFSYWIISRLAIVFAQNGHFPTLLGAWIGNIIFFLIGLVLFRKALR